MKILQLAWVIPLLPFAAAVAVALWGHRFRDRGGLLAVIGGGAAFGLALPVIWKTLQLSSPFHQQFTWFSVAGLKLHLGIYLDGTSALLLLVASFVSFLVLLYSLSYMKSEGPRRQRYFAEMTLFIGSMLGLVLADNYLEMYVFWELVGLCSYLLIGFWFERPSAAAAAIKAFVVTRFGDMFFLLGILLLWTQFKTLDFSALFSLQVPPDQAWVLGVAGLLIFGGAVGKSAQFPLHLWLPDAMEGPTTVSALIHAATMVNAGVYLVARTMPLLIQAPTDLLVIALLGGFTALLAASMACVNFDIKRVLAYSTISQLGYMFLGLGVGGYALAMGGEATGYTQGLFHLMNHAFFKALLFLGAGSVMHALAGNTDMRRMGGLWGPLKFTALMMLFGVLSNAGIPPTSGFWSKDGVLAAALSLGSVPAFWWVWLLGLLTVPVTAFYIFRLWFMTFSGKPRWEPGWHPHEPSWSMTVPLGILGFLALFSGGAIFGGFSRYVLIGAPELLSAGQRLWETFSDPGSLLSIALALAGLGLAYGIYVRGWDLSRYRTSWGAALRELLVQKYYLDRLALWLARRVNLGCATLLDRFDRRVVDGAVNGVAAESAALGARLRLTVSGYVGSYAAWMIGGIAILWLIYALWR